MVQAVYLTFIILGYLFGGCTSFTSKPSKWNNKMSAINMMSSTPYDGKKILVVQNGKGGHGTLGYYIAREVLANSNNAKVTLLQDKCNYKKPPFNQYDELKQLGVSIVDANLMHEDATADINGPFDFVIDNWSKSAANASFVNKLAPSVSQVTFISSAGMYNPAAGSTVTISESETVKEKNDVRQTEVAYTKTVGKCTFIRPQYLYGSRSSKRYLDYFLGRAVRKMPIPLPSHGEQLVALTHQADAAQLIVKSLGNPSAMNDVFNCGTDRYVSYKGLCELIYDALQTPSSDRKYAFYNPSLVKEIDFPFRPNTFITAVSKAKLNLNYNPKYDLGEEIKREVVEYLGSAASKEEWTTEMIAKEKSILESCGI